MREHMARSPVGKPFAEWPSRLSQNESGTHFSPLAAKRQKQTPYIGRTAPLTTAEPHLKHGGNLQGCYNDHILHATLHQARPPVFPRQDGRSARSPAMRLTYMPPAHVHALRLPITCSKMASQAPSISRIRARQPPWSTRLHPLQAQASRTYARVDCTTARLMLILRQSHASHMHACRLEDLKAIAICLGVSRMHACQ